MALLNIYTKTDDVDIVCPRDMAPPLDFENCACDAGIAIFEDEDGDYEIRLGITYIVWDKGVIFEEDFLSIYDL